MSATRLQTCSLHHLKCSPQPPAFPQLKKLADEAFRVSTRTRALYREICKVHQRLGTPDEKPGDLEKIRQHVHVLDCTLTAAALYRTLFSNTAVAGNMDGLREAV